MIRQLTAGGEIGPDEVIVAITTGTGFEELSRERVQVRTTDVPLDDLERELSTAVEGQQRAHLLQTPVEIRG